MHLAACRKGCSHCCHLPVMISEGEAEVLAACSDRSMRRPESPIRVIDIVAMGEQQRYIVLRSRQRPCPFLGNEGECVVYEHRPVACRTHLNLDDDDLLCRTVPSYPASVPYADATHIYRYSLLIQRNEIVADIRDFFEAEQPTP
ncbi:YkgJ family cysteine cluster protein [Serratia sp. 1D1416]|uniref:YkgJ family cysteine cluster protein n=2 Tax=Yersiniaceae TaxID=1903411 RepID=UPI00352A6711